MYQSISMQLLSDMQKYTHNILCTLALALVIQTVNCLTSLSSVWRSSEVTDTFCVNTKQGRNANQKIFADLVN